MELQENISLKNYNTFGVGAHARYFSEVSTEGELKDAVRVAQSKNIPVLVLGGGSNVLFTRDFEGLVVKLGLKGVCEEDISADEVLVKAKAGENWNDFVWFCLSKNYGGLENLALIPGNVGTSPMQNIGAYGVEIKDFFHSCKALNLQTLETETFDNERCKFGYRDSFFKNAGKGKYVVLEVAFKLTKRTHKIHSEYGAIRTELEKAGINTPSIQDIAGAVVKIRQSKLPDPTITGNAGSFFKNPIISMELYEPIKKSHPEIPGYSNGDMVKVPAGWLIERCGWKGKQIGNVACHDMQALVIINKTGEASGDEIFEFSKQIVESVRDTFGIELEREVNII